MTAIVFWRRPRTWISLVMLLAGIAACVVLWQRLGAEEVREAIVSLARYIPVLFVLEAGRLVAEMTSTRLVLKRAGVQSVPPLLLLRGQCLAHACNKLLPTGRMVGEILKAAILAPTVPGAKAIGAGGAAQLMTLLTNGAAAGVAAAIAWIGLGAPREASLFLAYSAVTLSLSVGVLLSLRSARLMNFFRNFRLTASWFHQLEDFASSGTRFGLAALCCHSLGKVARIGQYAVILVVLDTGVQPAIAVIAESVQILGGAAGEVVPAQVGAVEGALVLAAPLMGISGGQALSMGLVVHGTQLLFAGVALVVSLLLKFFARQ